MLNRLFGARHAAPERLARAPAGTRLYAVGDIHGRLDLLRELRAKIEADGAGFRGARKIVYLGDYVDRGLESHGVIDLLSGAGPAGFEQVFLKGNHDEWMLRFIGDSSVGPSWFFNGGDATLYSYGIGLENERGEPETQSQRYARLARRLGERLPERHRAFLAALELSHTAGDYYFVHAGVRPGIALEAQEPDDQLWIREEFLGSHHDFGKIVVHGHTPTADADAQPNRIGIDTGAYYSGILTCLVLEDEERRLLQTGARPPA